MNKQTPKKDSAIALIFSLFFLIILFAIGVTLLFRANLSKKTSSSLTNADLNKTALEGVINNVANNISHLNYDKSTNELGTSLIFDGKLKKINLATNTEPAFVLASSSGGVTNNGTSANITANVTKDLFKFTYGGVQINDNPSIANDDIDPDSKLNIEWQITGPNGDESQVKVGDKVFRYAYLLIDQSGKVDPNFSISSDTALANGGVMSYNTVNYGITWDVLNDFSAAKSDTRYDLINLLTKHPQDRAKFYNGNAFSDVESLYQQNKRILNYSWDQNEYLSTFFRDYDADADQQASSNTEYSNDYIVHNFFYPYSSPVTYKEKKVFNLKSIETGDLFSGLTSTGTDLNEDKIQTVIDNIEYLKHFPSEEYEDPTTWSNVNDFKPTAQREQIAASLIDYIDDDIISTHNYKLGETTAEWLARTNNKPVSGFEGFFIESIFFTTLSGNDKPKHDRPVAPNDWASNADLPWENSGGQGQFGLHHTNSTPWISCFPRIYSAYDLKGKSLESLTGGTLMLYTEFNLECTVTKNKGGVRTTFPYKRTGVEAVTRFNPINRKGGFGTNNRDHIHMHKPGKNNKHMRKKGGGSQPAYIYGRDIVSWAYSPYPEWNSAPTESGADTATITEQFNDNISYSVSDVIITFTKPFILFLDDDPFNDGPDADHLDDDDDGDGKPEHSMPEEDEIVQVFTLPQGGTLIDPTIGSDHSKGLFYVNVVDPRLSHLPSSYRALEKLAGTKVMNRQGGDPNFQTNNAWGAIAPWKVWRHIDPARTGEYNNMPGVGNLVTNGLVYVAALGEEDYKLSGFPAAEDVKFSYPMFDNETIFQNAVITDALSATDHNNLFDLSKIEGMTDLTSVSTIDLPVKLNSSNQVIGFGGINNPAEIGKISRGEPWRSLNLTQINMKLYKALKDAKQDGLITPAESNLLATLYKYANNYDDPKDTSKTLADFPFIFEDPAEETDSDPNTNFDDDFRKNYTIDDFNGGDAILLEQVSIGDIDPSSPSTLTLKERQVLGTFNPNTPYPILMKTLLSSVKVPRKDGVTVAPSSVMTGTEALAPWKLNAIVSSYNIDVQKALKLDANGFPSLGLSPFSRKYSYSSTEYDVGDSNYKEDFNLEYDSSEQKYKVKDIRSGSVRYGNIFAKRNLPFLTDLEREYLYANSKEFISTRFNYFSAILLIEAVTIVPNTVPTSSNIKQVTTNLRGNIQSHYRVRAELAHDTLTNHVTVLDYKILN